MKRCNFVVVKLTFQNVTSSKHSSMFQPSVYKKRRDLLRSMMNGGIVLLPGNTEAAMNYADNTYHFRQDSTFLYFFGINQPDLAGVIDLDNGQDYLFGNDVDLDDIIWMGPQPSLKDRAERVGVTITRPFNQLQKLMDEAIALSRHIHFLLPYRGKTTLLISKLLGIKAGHLSTYKSEELIRAVVALREIKDSGEITDIESMIDVAYDMHTTAMRMAKHGVVEREISGMIEGIALQKANGVSFPVILSINGQTLHNHFHGNTLKEGRMMVCDSGAESVMNYCSDITRTVPVGGRFSQRQRDIYEIVLAANVKAIEAIKPGILYKDIHLLSARIIAQGMKDLGLMKGDVDNAVAAGAHALFFPHGLGHMMGLDVHDMENLGENYVGYDNEISRSDQFGLAFLRLGKRLREGFVLTVEPGVYFIPALIDQWNEKKMHKEFINYDNLEAWKDFGGIRIEDDILVTSNACRVLGKAIPKTVAEVEATMSV